MVLLNIGLRRNIMDVAKFDEIYAIKRKLDSLENSKSALNKALDLIGNGNCAPIIMTINHDAIQRDSIMAIIDYNILKNIYKETCDKYDHVKKSFELL